ncbi:hypothetical protein TgHK011_009341 [Trichoderma gracile]|nr:hypothetical protein TgHK011_009341 [Trichoderma gracile]
MPVIKRRTVMASAPTPPEYDTGLLAPGQWVTRHSSLVSRRTPMRVSLFVKDNQGIGNGHACPEPGRRRRNTMGSASAINAQGCSRHLLEGIPAVQAQRAAVNTVRLTFEPGLKPDCTPVYNPAGEQREVCL